MEAIKSAVEANLGAAFVSAAAIDKERQLGRLAVLRIQDVPLSRTLYCITDPTRYCRYDCISVCRNCMNIQDLPFSERIDACPLRLYNWIAV